MDASQQQQQQRLARIVAAQRAREAKFQQREREKTGTQPQQQNQQQQQQQPSGTGRRWVRQGAGWVCASTTAAVHEYTAPASRGELSCALYAQLGLARGLRAGAPAFTCTARTLAALLRHFGTPRGACTRLVLADVDTALSTAAPCDAVRALGDAALAALDATAASRVRQGMDATPERVRHDAIAATLAALPSVEDKEEGNKDSKEEEECSVIDGVADCVVREVLLHCSVVSVGNAACTCRRLAALAGDEAFWALYARRRGWARDAQDDGWRASVQRRALGGAGREGRAVLWPGLHYHRTAHEFLWVEQAHVTAQPYVAVTENNVVEILTTHRHYDTSYVKMTK